MSIEEAILDVVRSLPPEQQQEVLKHAEQLRDHRVRRPRMNVKGLWANQGISLSKEEIDEYRREMWRNFPREDI